MNQKGVALVQVLIMSVLLTILATGLLKMSFGTHMLVTKVRHTDVRKQLAEACMAFKTAQWASTSSPLGACASGTCLINGKTITVTCVGTTKANFVVLD
ncbi:MAG: hypothetical protein COB53_06710 [Elusimicrobia bacterium]|nr:MAG: hypothetical protein COB53_06710 [Elusimicrobiota bacterium]